MILSPELLIIFALALLALIFAIIALIMIHKLRYHYLHLTKGVEPKNLIKALEGIQKTLSEHERSNVILKKEINALTLENLNHISTLSLKRFNPFSDTGGDQSFILALLDGHKDGIVITSLHSRENTRFYVKSVKAGVGIQHPLSPDEQKVIKS